MLSGAKPRRPRALETSRTPPKPLPPLPVLPMPALLNPALQKPPPPPPWTRTHPRCHLSKTHSQAPPLSRPAPSPRPPSSAEHVERWTNSSPTGGFGQSGFHSPTSPHDSVVSPSSAGLPSFSSTLQGQATSPYSSPTVPLNMLPHASHFSTAYPPPLSRYVN